ncbi:hypothetical protein [Bosea sp. 117]|uniref:hypothetical protein n=1 Tax=Bosea sp. 117 TaxID=1125973 RepID=UPI0004940E2E|nr:hypothetical protein [Bosea sp. 117]
MSLRNLDSGLDEAALPAPDDAGERLQPSPLPLDGRLPCQATVLLATRAERRHEVLERAGLLLDEAARLAGQRWPGFYGEPRPLMVRIQGEPGTEAGVDFLVLDGGHAERYALIIRAMERNLPVLLVEDDGVTLIELPTEEDCEAFLISGAEAGLVRHAAGAERLAAIAFAPRPNDEAGRLAAYIAEGEPRAPGRVEYDMLLALLARTRHDDVRIAIPPPCPIADFATGGRAHYLAWLDEVAARANAHAVFYGERWRSTIVTRSFLLLMLIFAGAIIGVLAPGLSVVTIPLQLVVTAVIFWDRRQASRGKWQRKWIEYRGLAECLRCLRFLIAADARTPWQDEPPDSWVDWYVGRLDTGAPDGFLPADRAGALLAYVLDVEIAGQIDYHRAAARRFLRLDVRLRRIARVLLGGAIAAGFVLFAIGLWRAGVSGVPWMTLTGIAMTVAPSLVAGITAFRSEFDIVRQIERSSRALNALTRLRLVARRLPVSPRMVRLVAERAAAIMTEDLTGWRTTLETRQSRLKRR